MLYSHIVILPRDTTELMSDSNSFADITGSCGYVCFITPPSVYIHVFSMG